MTQNEEQLIHKFLNRTLTDTEWDTLLQWLEDPAHKREFDALVRTDYYLELMKLQDHGDARYARMLSHIEDETRKRPLWKRPVTMAAASVVLLMGLALGWYLSQTDRIPTVEVTGTSIPQGTDGAILTLEDGTKVPLKKGRTYQNPNVRSNGTEVVYTKDKGEGEITYNTLTVRRGEQFALALSDGTKVWLNSDSQLRYPVHFVSGTIRQVELLYGEAYFDVSPAMEHQGDGFLVRHEGQLATVLGTEFNIKAYPQEQQIFTTLVEGSVEVQTGEEKSVLRPDERSVVDPTAHTIKVQPVNAQAETAWRRGLFMFQNKSLSEITVVLSRWYDVDIIIENDSLRTIGFKGTLGKDQPLEEILELIQKTKYINTYELTKEKVVIK
ncbi:MAG: DUF4974 domain-containing protein [Flavobacteriaceae bacterium]|nr:DUF4974 domain-containing protein [Flavobacteriaceae bacterium]